MNPNGTKIEEVFAALRTAEEEGARKHPTGHGTTNRISDETGIARMNVRNNLEKLRDQGRAHILCWTESPRSPVWVSGPGVDAFKPYTPPGQREKVERRQAPRPDADAVTTAGQCRAATYANIERACRKPQTWWSALESL